ncbi:MAG: hypothetical protein IOD12_05180 [Silvanigrellales bacterium]|nr:hypothetical protein [Silvanigrellales bacterium]
MCHCCGVRSAFQSLSICTQCFCAVEALPFSGCARCGRKTCAGACGELAVFSSVSCLFTYARPLSTLLLQAKNDQCEEGQQAFRDLFFLRVQRALGGLILRHGVERVVLAPLRIARLFALEWHPHCLFLEALEGLRAQGYAFEIDLPLKAAWVRQASRAASTRRSEASRPVYQPPCLAPLARLKGGVLVVDDVLTSGQTALALASTKTPRGTSGHRQGPFHLFALLRTPVDTP